MKKLTDIAENPKEKEALTKLVMDLRGYTTNSLKVLKAFENSKRVRPKKEGLEKEQENIRLQKKLREDLYTLFERMHRIVDYPSFVILEDELKKQYQD